MKKLIGNIWWRILIWPVFVLSVGVIARAIWELLLLGWRLIPW